MRFLFVHQNFPAQFKHLCAALLAQSHEVVALAIHAPSVVAGVKVIRYTLPRGNTKGQHPWLLDMDTKLIRAEACAKAALQLKARGFIPDVMVVHPGWGEPWFLKEVFPNVRCIAYLEYFYKASGGDMGFDPEFPASPANLMRLRLRNAAQWIGLEMCDQAISPTHWQKSTHPKPYQDKIKVVFDGIDTEALKPNPDAVFALPPSAVHPNGLRFKAGDTANPVISFVNRNLEPYRGWHIFARSLPAILAKHPTAHVVIVGGDEVSYGTKPMGKDGKPTELTYRELYWNEARAQISDSDQTRVHFVGKLAHAQLCALFQVCAAHVYLTYPFVLSWSMLEAMSQGAVVIGSNTAPVQEVIEDGKNGLLVDFFDAAQISAMVSEVLKMQQKAPKTYAKLKAAARKTVVARYDLQTVCLPAQLEFFAKN